jgi:hypothetical protein
MLLHISFVHYTALSSACQEPLEYSAHEPLTSVLLSITMSKWEVAVGIVADEAPETPADPVNWRKSITKPICL